MISPDKLYTLKDAGPLTGNGTTRLFEEIRRGNLGAVKNGRRTLIPGSEILRYRAALQPTKRAPVLSEAAEPQAA